MKQCASMRQQIVLETHAGGIDLVALGGMASHGLSAAWHPFISKGAAHRGEFVLLRNMFVLSSHALPAAEYSFHQSRRSSSKGVFFAKKSVALASLGRSAFGRPFHHPRGSLPSQMPFTSFVLATDCQQQAIISSFEAQLTEGCGRIVVRGLGGGDVFLIVFVSVLKNIPYTTYLLKYGIGTLVARDVLVSGFL